MRAVLEVTMLWVFASACGTAPVTSSDAPPFCTDQMPAAPTFTNVQNLFTGTCTTCHGLGVELDLAAGVSYAMLVNQTPPSYADPPTDESCGKVLVSPGDPTGSYLYQKVTLDPPCAGVQMPRTDIGTSAQLIPCEQQLIHDWIAAGALDN
jgi:hypothetical protein